VNTMCKRAALRRGIGLGAHLAMVCEYDVKSRDCDEVVIRYVKVTRNSLASVALGCALLGT
jgi:hypothetical protein